MILAILVVKAQETWPEPSKRNTEGGGGGREAAAGRLPLGLDGRRVQADAAAAGREGLGGVGGEGLHGGGEVHVLAAEEVGVADLDARAAARVPTHTHTRTP